MTKKRQNIWIVFLMIIIFLIGNQKLSSQNSSNILDSLITGKPVEEQLEALHEYYLDIRYVNLDLAELLCDTALSIAKNSSDTSLLARAYLNRGTVYYFREQYDSAITNYNMSINLSEATDNDQQLAIVYSNFGILRKAMSQYAQARILFRKALFSFKQFNDTAGQIRCLVGIGNSNYISGNYDSALVYYKKAKQLNDHFGMQNAKMTLLINIGAIYETQNSFQSSLDCYYQALDISNELQWTSDRALILKNIGAVYLQTGDNMKALDVLFESLYLRDSLGLEGAKARTLILIGKAYEFEGNLQRANEMYIQSLNILHKNGDLRQEAHALTYIGKNLQLQNKHQNALAYYRMSLNVAKNAGLNLEVSENYKHLVLLFGETQEEDSTFKYLDLYAEVKQKLSVELDENPAELRNEADHAADSEALINSSKKAQTLNSLTWIFSTVFVSGLIVIIILLLAFIMISRKNNRHF